MNQIAQKKTTQVVVSELDKMLEADSGAGLENITTEDMQIPFIRIIQALSPQLQKDDPLYIKVLSKEISSIPLHKKCIRQTKVFLLFLVSSRRSSWSLC